MRALTSNGSSSVQLGEVPEPTPTTSEAVVAVEAISINRGETFLLEAPPRGWRPGKDFAGVVVAAAADGSGPQVGTRVVGHAPHSGWADMVAVPVDTLVELPDHVPTTTAAALPLAGLTALRLARRAALAAGTTVLMTGASGGVGHYFAELAAGSGAQLSAVVGSHERGARLRELGAHTLEDVAQAPTGFDVGLDSVGGDSLAAVRARVTPSGRIIWFGQASREPARLDFFDWVEGTAAAPIEQFDYTRSERSLHRDLSTLVHLVAHDRIHPMVERVRSLDDAAAGIEDLRGRRVLGNLVVAWQ